MVRVMTVPAKQVHFVPSRPHAPRGPFPPEIFGDRTVVDDYEPQPDGGGEQVYGTAQNGYRAPRIFRCKSCGSVLLENELDDHECFEEPHE
jgi:hypothetical protein